MLTAELVLTIIEASLLIAAGAQINPKRWRSESTDMRFARVVFLLCMIALSAIFGAAVDDVKFKNRLAKENLKNTTSAHQQK